MSQRSVLRFAAPSLLLLWLAACATFSETSPETDRSDDDGPPTTDSAHAEVIVADGDENEEAVGTEERSCRLDNALRNGLGGGGTAALVGAYLGVYLCGPFFVYCSPVLAAGFGAPVLIGGLVTGALDPTCVDEAPAEPIVQDAQRTDPKLAAPTDAVADVPWQAQRDIGSCVASTDPEKPWVGTWQTQRNQATLTLEIDTRRVSGDFALRGKRYPIGGTVDERGKIRAVMSPAQGVAGGYAGLDGDFPDVRLSQVTGSNMARLLQEYEGKVIRICS